ncbi:MAG: hypothetical protein D3908_08350, partial [Candidatus Electrothrix sp. AUS4]|nr:hypothetical protein [Candidatus Electrothrix sp. AUS4]
MIRQRAFFFYISFALVLCSLTLLPPLSAVAEEEGSQAKEPAGKNLVEKKCTICHSIERVHGADKIHSEWEQTIAKMMRYSDQMDFLNQQEKEDIVEYLANRKRMKAES